MAEPTGTTPESEPTLSSVVFQMAVAVSMLSERIDHLAVRIAEVEGSTR